MNAAVVQLEQSPPRRNLFLTDQSARHKVEPLATDAECGVLAKRLGAVRKEVRSRNLALDQHRMAGAFPPDRIRHLAADAGLLREHHATTIVAQPLDSLLDKHRVSHKVNSLACTESPIP